MKVARTTSAVVGLVVALLAADAGAVAQRPARGKNGMVASAHPLASEAGVAVLKQGGNAVDAAVATALAVSVVEPFSAGIGGGGFAVIALAGKGEGGAADVRALDFREKAPAKATKTMFVDAQGKVVPGSSTDGWLSVGVPGTLAGLAELHARHGKLPWRKVVQPAIDLARKGFAVGWRYVENAADRRDVMARFPESMRVYFGKDGAPLADGDVLRQPDLARTLQDVAKDPRSFYEGRVAKAIAADAAANGGLLTLDDLKAYRPTWRTPVCGAWRGDRVCSMPPPSSGGVHLVQILNLLGDVDLPAAGWHDVDVLHRLVEAMRIAYADRAEHLGDPAFVDVPVAGLTSPAYAAERAREIDPKKARRSVDVKAGDKARLAALGKESQDTSHLSVVDADRNAVSLTFTVNLQFGSGVVAKGTGVLMNDEMDDFAAAPGVPNAFGLVGKEANAVQPGKIPLSSMSPTVVLRDGEVRLATGASGGSKIITATLQVYLHALVYGMDAQAAVAAPRVHHQWLPDAVVVEPWGLDDATVEALKARGHAVTVAPGGNARAHCVKVTDDGWLEGGSDPRTEGAPRGF